MKKLFSAIASASFLLSASGCATYVENQASLAFEPIYPHANLAADEGVPTGGIYKASSNGLFASDIRARDVGDILTVSL